ncbi:MAG: TonB-dependent receptor [Chitinophagaceae bacterium]|nr:TonB-dependent receptor [Chitinophagaceae bacterium]
MNFKPKGMGLVFPVNSCIVLAMKLTVALLIIATLQVSAKTYSQQLTINEKNLTVSHFLQLIKKQAGYSFLYDDLQLKDIRIASISVVNAGVEHTLDEGFKNLPLAYKIFNKTIVVKRVNNKTASPQEQVVQPPADITITGVVMNPDGEALSSVSVMVKGSNSGTTTDGNGVFSIQVPDGNAVLVFSYVGYDSQEMVVGNQRTINLVLTPSAGSLGDVVVVAYGRQKKISVTGAIASISTREIKQSPAANLAVTLAGRLPGLTALQRSGEPGRDATALFLRGIGTLNGTAPIILVDGVEREMTYIDPNEVENVTILKDASSTALFGVRGANGVILVTTKRGASGKPSIGLTYEYGLQGFTRSPSMVNSYDWARLKNEAWSNDNPGVDPDDPVNQPPYSEYALDRFMYREYPEAYPNNNWQKMLINDYVAQKRYNLNLSGGSEYVQYFVNVGFLDQGGQWKVDPSVTDYDPSSFLRRYNFRSNIDAKLNKAGTLSTFLNAAGYFERVNSPNANTDEIFRRTYAFFPVVLPGPLTPSGEVLIGPGNYNESPWAMINRSGYRQETRNNITASWGLKQDFGFLTEGLSAKFMASFDTRTVYSLTAGKDYQRWIQIIDPNTPNHEGMDSVQYTRLFLDRDNTPLSIGSGSNFQSFFNFQLSVDYNRVFKQKHAFTGLLLAQQETRVLPNDRLPYNLRGISMRAAYAYDSKYLLEFNAGYNGSEQFAKGRRYGFFPTLSGGWVVSNEDFLKSSDIISLLKIRASYGKVGSDRLGGRRFLYLDDIQRIGGGGFSPSLGRGGYIAENYIGNPNIQWEIAKKANIGLELGFLHSDLNIMIDVFKERRDNILISRQTIPMVYGIEPGRMAPVNMGVVENKGYEIELNYRKAINRNWSVLSKLNFNFARNKVLFSDELQYPDDYAYRYRQTGSRLGQVFGYKLRDGYYASYEEIADEGLTYTGYTVRPGDFKYVDTNGDKVIDERDMVPIGYSAIPEYTLGAAFSITYKNFDVSFLFQGNFNVSQPLSGYGTMSTSDFRQRHLYAWTAERAAKGEKILYPRLTTGGSSSENDFNEFFIENRSFVRLKNAEIGYRLPEKWVRKIGSKEVRFYANGFNLITWDKMRTKDFDPEINNSLSYPVYQVFNSGVNITF